MLLVRHCLCWAAQQALNLLQQAASDSGFLHVFIVSLVRPIQGTSENFPAHEGIAACVD
jgi:hypothetical protein